MDHCVAPMGYISFNRPNVEINVKEKSEYEFMIREWHSVDYEILDDEGNDEDKEENKVYHIYLFGVDAEGRSVCLDVENFTPYFYVKVPDNWSQLDVKKLEGSLRRMLWKQSKHLMSCKLFKRKDAYGFNAGREFNFVRLVFNNHKTYRNAMYKFKDKIQGFEFVKFVLYESNIDPMLVFMHLQDIQATGWVKIKSHKETVNRNSRCQIDISVDWNNVTPSDKVLIPPIMTMSFDLECYSFNGAFPKPEVTQNYITQIGSSFQRFGSNEIFKTVIVVGECNEIPGVMVINTKNEREAILKWVDLINTTDPDQLIGYNIDDFDWTYIWKRSEKLGILDEIFSKLSRLLAIPGEFKQDKFESNAFGVNSFNFISTPGVGQIDLMHWFRKNTKLDKYSLDFVSQTFLKETKRDVSPQQIFDWSGPRGTKEQRTLVADYCAQDTVLPLRLMDDRCMFLNMVEMSRVTCVPFTWLLTRGEQIKAFSQINKELRKRKFVLPSYIQGTDDEFEGATVLSAERGYYTNPVSGLDFASLYPSIMIAHNLCVTTWVRSPDYLGLEGVEYKNFELENETYTFVQNTEGVIPGILTRLWQERKVVKKQMGTATDPRMKAILNAKQLAIKVSMNSIYGVCGVGHGSLPCRAIAASVTYTGRQMIIHSKKCAEEWYDGSEKCGGIKGHVVYGDSVTAETPVVIKNGSLLTVKEIQSLGVEWEPYSNFKPTWAGFPQGATDKQQAYTRIGTSIYTSNGWKRIKRVIRHKTSKKLYRVVTEQGVVEVTEDHSLLDPQGHEIKPCDIEIGQELMTRFEFWQAK